MAIGNRGNRGAIGTLKVSAKKGLTPPPKKKRAKRLVKVKPERIDGLSPKDVEKIRKAIRQVWSWSYPRMLVIRRCLLPNGFSRCENPKCKQRCPKVFVDHIQRVGDVDAGFLERLFCPSSELQGLCKKCHAVKTKQERKEVRAAVKKIDDFY